MTYTPQSKPIKPSQIYFGAKPDFDLLRSKGWEFEDFRPVRNGEWFIMSLVRNDTVLRQAGEWCNTLINRENCPRIIVRQATTTTFESMWE